MSGRQANISMKQYAIKLLITMYDIFAINIAFFSALVIRFYINGRFSELAIPYIGAYFRFTPYYTIISIIIFALFQMYNMAWRYTGFNDLKRIALANLITLIIQVLGSILFVRRMPITYYAIGGIIQFTLVCLVRFLPRVIFYETIQDKTSSETIPVMIIGAGENARVLQDNIIRDTSKKEKPVCILDYTPANRKKKAFNGVPLIYGIDKLTDSIKKYKIGCVYISDSNVSEAFRRDLNSMCSEMSVELRTFIIGSERTYGKIVFSELMKVTSGEVKLIEGEQECIFKKPEIAEKSVGEVAFVNNVEAKDNRLVVTIKRETNNLDKETSEWIKKYEEENGEEVTFF